MNFGGGEAMGLVGNIPDKKQTVKKTLKILDCEYKRHHGDSIRNYDSLYATVIVYMSFGYMISVASKHSFSVSNDND